MDDPDVWRWIWLVAAVVFAAGEIATVGFFLLPFALGALVAAVLAFLGVGVPVELVAFAAVSVGSFAALRPLAHRLDRSSADHGVGAKRLVGAAAVVLEEIPTGGVGMVQVGGEQWRAESADGSAIASGRAVTIGEVRGTRAVVSPTTPDPTD